jgi:hypothetical protein
VFVCKTDVVVCSRVYGMALAYSLNGAHAVVKHCKRVGATAGMRMSLPSNLLPTSKDAELRSIVPRATPEVTSTPLTSGEQDGCGKVMFGAFGKGGSLGSENGDDRDDGHTTSKEGSTDSEGGPSKGLRIAPVSDVGPRMEVDYGEGSADSLQQPPAGGYG